MRNKKNEGVADDRNDVESEKRTAMSPKIENHPAGIGVDRAEQCAKRIVETNDKNTRTERLQKFRDEPHPEFLARADDENGDEQNDEIAFEPKKIRDSGKSVLNRWDLRLLAGSWRIRLWFHGSVVLVCGRCRCSLRRAS